VGTGDPVFIVEVHAEADGRSFLASIKMDEAGNLSRGKLVVDTVLKGPDLTHLAIGLQ
jgi:hypothetical protein